MFRFSQNVTVSLILHTKQVGVVFHMYRVKILARLPAILTEFPLSFPSLYP